jgi:hypothetical protein
MAMSAPSVSDLPLIGFGGYDPASDEAGKWMSFASVAAIGGLLVGARRRSARHL